MRTLWAIVMVVVGSLSALGQDKKGVDQKLLKTILAHCKAREKFMNQCEGLLEFTEQVNSTNVDQPRSGTQKGLVRFVYRHPDMLVETDAEVTTGMIRAPWSHTLAMAVRSPFDTGDRKTREVWIGGDHYYFDLMRRAKHVRHAAAGSPLGFQNYTYPFEHVVWHVGFPISRNLTRDVVKVVKCKRLPNGDAEVETKSAAVGEDMRFVYVFRPSEQFFPIEHENRGRNAQTKKWNTAYKVKVTKRHKIGGRWLPLRSVIRSFDYETNQRGELDLAKHLLRRQCEVTFKELKSASRSAAYDVAKGYEPFSLR